MMLVVDPGLFNALYCKAFILNSNDGIFHSVSDVRLI